MNAEVLPIHASQTLPFVASWAVVTNLPLLVPSIMGASAFIIQLSVVVWFFLPLATGFIGHYIGAFPTRFRLLSTGNPVLIGYGIVGVTSAIIHLGVGLWIYHTPEIGWNVIYWPAYSAVKSGPNLLLQGGMLFCQYGYMSLWSSVITLAVYIIGPDRRAPKSPSTHRPASHHIVSLIGVMIIFGPGAGAAYLLYNLEIGVGSPLSVSKNL